MAEIKEVHANENTSETEEPTLISEQAEKKKSVLLTIVKGNYARKTAKCNKMIGKLQDEILILNTDKNFLKSKITELESKINLENSAVIALCNSNNFLENVKGQSFRIDSILIFLTFHNNKKKIIKERKVQKFKIEIAQINSQIELIDEEIKAVELKIKNYETESKRFELKQQNITAIEKLNITNPAISFFLSKNSEEAIADLNRYCFKEVSEEELSRLEGFDYSRRRSKTNDKKIIIRFGKEEKEIFEKALAT